MYIIIFRKGWNMEQKQVRVFEPIELEHLAKLYAADLADLEECDDNTAALREILTREVDLLLEELGHRSVVIDAIKPHKHDVNERGYLETAFAEDYHASIKEMTTDVLEAYREELTNQGYPGYTNIFETEIFRRRTEERKIARYCF